MKSRSKEQPALVQQLCECGCGKPTKGTNRFINGHNHKGKHRSAETRRKISDSLRGRVSRPKHGQARQGRRTSEYSTFHSMKQRCLNPKSQKYARYGQRGIKVCSRWRGPDGFIAFMLDMGQRPPGLTLDRRDNDGNYSCGKCEECITNGWKANCRWTTRKIQQNNLSNNLAKYGSQIMQLRGQGHTYRAISQSLGLSIHSIYSFFRRKRQTEVLPEMVSVLPGFMAAQPAVSPI